MQLHTARLCLDCQDVHDGKICPVCGSESFAYISRWIPAPERRLKPRPVEPAPQAEVYRQLLAADRAKPVAARWLTRGVLGLAAVSAAAWVLKWKTAGEQTDRARPSATPPERVVP
jgi:hypothetical protein